MGARQDLHSEWWSLWREEDFSWDNLQNKECGDAFEDFEEGFSFGTLEDYWLKDPLTGKPREQAELADLKELVTAPDGKLWHIAHIPLLWPDGTATPKARWNDAE